VRVSESCDSPTKVGTLKRGTGSSPADVTESVLVPDTLDLDIYREMFRSGVPNLAGIDPRLNATQIARHLRLGRARVAARLKRWSDSGFLVRYDVWLNPALFGWQGAWLNIRVDHARAKPHLLSRLGLIDGAVSAMEFLGEWVTFGLVSLDDTSLERSVGLIRGLTGVRDVEPPILWQIPEPKRKLSTLDVRIVRALRERPTATLGSTAQRVGISTRTMTRRYSELVEDWMAWFVPVFDFRASSAPAVSLGVTLRPGASRENVARQIRNRYPLTLQFGNADVGPQMGPDFQAFMVMPPSAAHLEEVEQFAASIEDVTNLDANVLVRMHSFPGWFDRHLETLATQRPGSGPPRRPTSTRR